MDPADLQKIRSLADAVCSDTAADDELDALADLLRGNAEAQSSYLNYCRLHTELQFFFRGRQAHHTVLDKIHSQAAIPASSPPLGFLGNVYHGTVGFFSQEVPFSLLVATFVTALGLLAGSLVYVSQPKSIAKTSPSRMPANGNLMPKQNIVGKITDMVDVRWSDDQTATVHGANVPLGRKYALSSGLLEITYDTGAKVILQGPVAYEVDSRDGGFLSVGKLTARLEKGDGGLEAGRGKVTNLPSPARGRGAGGEGRPQLSEYSNHNPIPPALTLALSRLRERGPDSNPQSLIPDPSSLSPLPSPLFTIRTPTATVTDLGTEFGVEVTKSGVTSTHVFRGLVELQPHPRGNQSYSPIRLAANEAACVELTDVDRNAVVRRVKADRALFVRAEQLPRLSEESRQQQSSKSFQRWQAFSRELRRDPSLLAYYDFQRQPKNPLQLVNVAESGRGAYDGEIVKAAWCDGRMSGKDALEFSGPATYVRLNLPQENNDLTLAVWICFDSLESDMSSTLLMSEGWGKDGQVHWQLDNSERRLVFSTTAVSDKEEFTIPNGAAKSWEIVSGSRTLHQWLQLVSVFDHQAKHVRFYVNGRQLNQVDYATFAPLVIGQSRIGKWDRESRVLHGKIDELAILGRTLNDADIRRMYEEGKP